MSAEVQLIELIQEAYRDAGLGLDLRVDWNGEEATPSISGPEA